MILSLDSASKEGQFVSSTKVRLKIKQKEIVFFIDVCKFL